MRLHCAAASSASSSATTPKPSMRTDVTPFSSTENEADASHWLENTRTVAWDFEPSTGHSEQCKLPSNTIDL